MDVPKKRKPYITPKIQSPEIIGVIPLAITVLQMAAVGALAGAAAIGVSKAFGFHDYKNIEALLPVE